MSGFVVKRTRGVGTKWRKRYWQLLGDGALIYFSGDHRLKVLGEIDIAHTCYEVRHGSENCEIKFPPSVQSNCCFSVAVLKRTYYFYAFTEIDAEKWVTALQSTSYLINRLRPRNLTCSPAVQVAIKALNDETPPVPPSQPPPHSKPAPPLPARSYSEEIQTEFFEERFSSENSESFDDEPSELPIIKKLSRGGRNIGLSVPDLRFESTNITHNGSWIDGSPRIRSSSMSTATPSPLTSSSSIAADRLYHHHSGEQRRRRKVSYSPQFSDIEISQTPKKTHKQQRYRSQGNLLESDGQTISTTTSTLPSPAKLSKMKQKWKSECNVQWSPAFERLEELQQQEDAIRKRIKEMKKFDSFSYLAHRGVAVLPPQSPTAVEKETTVRSSSSFNEKSEVFPPSPSYHSQPSSAPEFKYPSSSSGIEKLPKKAPKISPKPTNRRPTPAFPYSLSPFQKLNNAPPDNNLPLILEANSHANTDICILDPDGRDKSERNDNITHPESKSFETNIWVKQELTKVHNYLYHKIIDKLQLPRVMWELHFVVDFSVGPSNNTIIILISFLIALL